MPGGEHRPDGLFSARSSSLEAAACGLRGKLGPRRDASLREDVSQVCLHGAPRDEQPPGDFGIREPLRDMSDDLELGRGQAAPPERRAPPLAAPPRAVGARLVQRHRTTFVPQSAEFAGGKCSADSRDVVLVSFSLGRIPREAVGLAGSFRGP